MICGAPKIGKSHLMIKITHILNEALFKVKNHTFCTTTTTEHLDGYVQQPIVIFDDHYKCNDGKQQVDASHVMDAISCTSYRPRFAYLCNKGMLFTSKIVIITSNYGWPRTIYLPGALQRRHKHHIIAIKVSDYKHDFSHLLFYHTIEIIDPWQGNYSYPFSELNDVPRTKKEMDNFPFRHRYKNVSLDSLIAIIVNDYNRESNVFASLIA